MEASSLLVAADDFFGEVFLAGISIAFAAIGSTIFVGILVRGKYDDVEQSLFDAQDEEVMREGERAAASRSQVTKDFFGEINPTPVDEPVPSEAPTTLREPADQSSP